MNTYLIGDVHGCYDELIELLEIINYQRGSDRLIFVGDLINRGSNSVEVLRFVRGLGSGAEVVLGNHDISLLAYSAGVYEGKHSDFPSIMEHPDSNELVAWLRQQPLLIYDEELDIVVTHAGIPPRWSIRSAIKQAAKAEARLRGEKWVKYLKHAYKKNLEGWSDDFDKYDKFRYRINGFTRMRYCNSRGEPELQEKGPPDECSADCLPWFDSRTMMQDDENTRLFFGHWAALGYYQGANAICLDSGCVWGDSLTAVKVEKHGVERYKVDAKKKKH